MNILARYFGSFQLAVVVLYSLAIMASVVPTFSDIPNAVVLVYYFFVPGFVITLFIAEKDTIFHKLAYSALFGLTVVYFISSVRQSIQDSVPLPFNVIVPMFSIALASLYYYNNKNKMYDARLF